MSRPALIVLAALVLAVPAAAKTTYTFKLTPGAGGGSLLYYDVNSTQQIVAETTPASGNPTCTLVHKNTSLPVADPKGSYTQCYGLSDGADVVGFYIPTSNANTAVGFTYTAGKYADYIAIGSVAAQGGTQLNAISSSGKVIAGTYSDAKGLSRIFTLVKGKQQDIAVSGAKYLVSTGVNDTSDLTVQSFDAKNNLLASYLVSGGKTTIIAYPGGTHTTVHVINDAKVLVGAYTDASGNRHGFTYDAATGTYSSPIDAPKAAVTGLLGISKTGVISGYATPTGGVPQGLIGTPVKKAAGG